MGNTIEYVSVKVKYNGQEKPYTISKGASIGTCDKNDMPQETISKKTGPSGYMNIEAKSQKEFNSICDFLKRADADKNGKIDSKDLIFLENNGGTKTLYSDGMGSIIGIDKSGKHFSVSW